MSKKTSKNLVTATALIGAATAATIGAKKLYENKKGNTAVELTQELDLNREVYFVGGGLASLAGAAYLIRA